MSLQPTLKIKKDNRFNTLEKLGEVIDASKLIIFSHKAENVDILAAKDAGKSYPVDMGKIMCMEKDPYFNCVTLMKYATKSASKCRGQF